MDREPELILDGSPCQIDYSNQNILTVSQVKKGDGYRICPNYETCNEDEHLCALQQGHQVAQIVIKEKATLKQTMEGFSQVPYLGEIFWTSTNWRDFEKVQGKGKILAEVERAARVILQINSFESVFSTCGNCGGSKLTKLVYDSIWLNIRIPCAGTGETRGREAEYCPKCDKEPRGGIIMERGEELL